MAKCTPVLAQPEQPIQSLENFLNEDVLIWLNTSADSLSELAELLQTIGDIAKTSGNMKIYQLANLGVRAAGDYACDVRFRAETLCDQHLGNVQLGVAK